MVAWSWLGDDQGRFPREALEMGHEGCVLLLLSHFSRVRLSATL